MTIRAMMARHAVGRLIGKVDDVGMTWGDDPRDDRSVEIGNAIQSLVAADPDLATSVIGMGLDALSSTLIHAPAKIRDMGGWIDLIVAIRAYIETGERDTLTDSLLAGTLDIRAVG